jgi:hypothetical protein
LPRGIGNWQLATRLGYAIAILQPTAVLSIVLAALTSGYDRPASAGPARLLTVTIATSADGTNVVLEGDAPLPVPTVGVVDGPPRIYLDFTGVLPPSSGVFASSAPSIRRVRVALHSDPPVVTRVVIDLVRQTSYRIEPDPGAPNRLVISIGESEDRGRGDEGRAPRVEGRNPRTPPSPRSDIGEAGGSRTSDPGKQRLPGAEQTYAQQVSGLLARLEKMRPLLVSIDTRREEPGVSLQVAMSELDSIAKALAGIRPSRRMAPIHDRLQQSCNLASQAVRARMESMVQGSSDVAWTGASAAAGALLLLDRVRADLGLGAQRGT